MLNIILFCLQVYNLGTGRGYSVLEMVKAVEKASGKTVSKGTHGSPESLVTSLRSMAVLSSRAQERCSHEKFAREACKNKR